MRRFSLLSSIRFGAALVLALITQLGVSYATDRIPVLRSILNNRFTVTHRSAAPLRIQIRSKELWEQLAIEGAQVDFSKEEVLVVSLERRPAGATSSIREVILEADSTRFEVENRPPPAGMMFNDMGNLPVDIVVVPRQAQTLPGFSTSLPADGGKFRQLFFFNNIGGSIEEIARRVEGLGLLIENRAPFPAIWPAEREYVAAVCINDGMPREIYYSTSTDYVSLGSNPDPPFSPGCTDNPFLFEAEATRYLVDHLILPIKLTSKAEAMNFALEHIRGKSAYTLRKDWRRPSLFNEVGFRSANNLPSVTDFSAFMRKDINDYFSVVTESSPRAHLRMRLPSFQFSRTISELGTYQIALTAEGRMQIEVTGWKGSPLASDLQSGLARALYGIVEGAPKTQNFCPIYTFSDYGDNFSGHFELEKKERC